MTLPVTRTDLSTVKEYTPRSMTPERPRPPSTALTTSVKLLGSPCRMETRWDSSAPRWLCRNLHSPELTSARFPQPLLGCAFFVAGALSADWDLARFRRVLAKFRRHRDRRRTFFYLSDPWRRPRRSMAASASTGSNSGHLKLPVRRRERIGARYAATPKRQDPARSFTDKSLRRFL